MITHIYTLDTKVEIGYGLRAALRGDHRQRFHWLRAAPSCTARDHSSGVAYAQAERGALGVGRPGLLHSNEFPFCPLDATILPSVLFLPEHHSDGDERASSLIYAKHEWGSTRKSYAASAIGRKADMSRACALHMSAYDPKRTCGPTRGWKYRQLLLTRALGLLGWRRKRKSAKVSA